MPFDCENPAKGDQPSTADCAKSFGTAFLDINSHGGPSDCFDIHNVNPPSGAPYVQATVAGPVAINGLYVPVPKTVKTDYDSLNRVALHGLSSVQLRFGTFFTKDIDLHFQAVPKQGVFHLVDISPEVNTPKFLGSLPISGSFSIDLLTHASRVHIGVGLPSPFSFGAKKTAQAKLYLYANNREGLRYDGISATIPALWLGPLYVENLHFAYELSSNSWEGTAKVTLPGSQIALNAAPPPPDFGFKIVKGKFASAGFGINFQPPTQPDLFPPFHTVLLSHIGGAVGLESVPHHRHDRHQRREHRRRGRRAARRVRLRQSIRTRSRTIPDRSSSRSPAERSTASRSRSAATPTSVKVPILGALPLLHAYGLYEYPDYFEFGGGFSFKVGIVSLDGSVSGFVYPSSGKFNAEAGLNACLKKFKVGYKFVSVTISPCLSRRRGRLEPRDRLLRGRRRSVPGLRHDSGPGRGRLPLGRLAAEADAVQLRLLRLSRALAVRRSRCRRRLPGEAPEAGSRRRCSACAEPAARRRSSSPIRTARTSRRARDAITVEDTEPNTVLVGLRHPAAGNWTIAAAAGSVPIADVASADGLPDPGITARVTGAGHRRAAALPLHAGRRTHGDVRRARPRRLARARERPRPRWHDRVHACDQDAASTRSLRSSARTARPRATSRSRRTPLRARFRPARPAGVRATRRRGTIRVSWRGCGRRPPLRGPRPARPTVPASSGSCLAPTSRSPTRSRAAAAA